MQYLSTVIAENFLTDHSTYILTFSAEVSSATKSETTLEWKGYFLKDWGVEVSMEFSSPMQSIYILFPLHISKAFQFWLSWGKQN